MFLAEFEQAKAAEIAPEALGYGDAFNAPFAPDNAQPVTLNDQAQPRGADDAVKYSFAGAKAKPANLDNLATAEARIAAGEDAETVRQETGWYQGTDGKWRFEGGRAEMAISEQDGFIYIDGSKDIGYLDLNGYRESAPIRLEVGDESFGLEHAKLHETEILNAGFESVEQFIYHVANNFTEVRKGNSARLILAIPNQRTGDMMTVMLKASDDGSFWSVSNAAIVRAKYLNKFEKLPVVNSDGSRNASGERQGLSLSSENKTAIRADNALPTGNPNTTTTNLTKQQAIDIISQDDDGKRLLARGKVKVLGSMDEAPENIQDQITLSDDNGNIQGFFDPATDTTYLVADDLTADSVQGVLVHEVGVHAWWVKANSDNKAALEKRAMQLLNQGKRFGNEKIKAFYAAVEQRMMDAGVQGDAEEAVAYIVEEAINQAGANKSKLSDSRVIDWVAKNISQSLANFLSDFISSVRASMHRIGWLKTANLTGADLVAIAKRNMREVATSKGVENTQINASFSKSQRDSLAKFVRDAVTHTKDYTHTIGKTPEFLRSLGVPVMPIKVTSSTIRKAVGLKEGVSGRNHNVELDALINLPSEIENPIAVFSTSPKTDKADGGIKLVSEIKDKSGSPVVIAIHMNREHGAMQVNLVRSIHGKDDAKVQFDKWKEDGKLLFADEERLQQAHGITLIQFQESMNTPFGGNAVDSDSTTSGSVVKYSKGGTTQPKSAFTVPEFGIVRKAQQRIQDNFNRIKQIQDAITEQGGKVAPTSDVYKAEERFWGKVGSRTAEFQHSVKNLISDISKANIDLGNMEEYLYARHAGERNQYIRTNVDANNMAGSGMTDAQADQIMQNMEAKYNGAATLFRTRIT